MDFKHFLTLALLLISFSAISQKVSIGESQAGDSVFLEFDFPFGPDNDSKTFISLVFQLLAVCIRPLLHMQCVWQGMCRLHLMEKLHARKNSRYKMK